MPCPYRCALNAKETWPVSSQPRHPSPRPPVCGGTTGGLDIALLIGAKVMLIARIPLAGARRRLKPPAYSAKPLRGLAHFAPQPLSLRLRGDHRGLDTHSSSRFCSEPVAGAGCSDDETWQVLRARCVVYCRGSRPPRVPRGLPCISRRDAPTADRPGCDFFHTLAHFSCQAGPIMLRYSASGTALPWD